MTSDNQNTTTATEAARASTGRKEGWESCPATRRPVVSNSTLVTVSSAR